MDERQAINAGKAALITLAVICLGALGVLVWEYATTKEVTNTAAVAVLLVSGGLFWAFERMFGAEAPRSLLGRELPTGATAAERAERRRAYAVDALALAISGVVLGIGGFMLGDPDAFGSLGLPGGPVTGAVLGFVALFVISFSLSWLVGEADSRAVEKRLARLEAQV
ncbi:MAG: hypothetical protein QM708_01125 [Propioniciclava sp.]|uniref:hypothetical protein n=1 Tax=Propioniciclava sp. TaxID=2038686 RepID=UPI0039E35869